MPHEFNGQGADCQAVNGGKMCNEARDNLVHQFVAQHACYHPSVVIQVFVQGMHYATLAWQLEDGDWYSAWFAPHNQPETYHRIDKMDALTAGMVGLHVTSLLSDQVTADQLANVGVTNEYVTKKAIMKL